MARAVAHQFYEANRFLFRVRIRSPKGLSVPWTVLAVSKVQSVDDGVMLSWGAEPEHQTLRVIAEVSRLLREASRVDPMAEFELWRVARSTSNQPAVLTRESFEFEGYTVRPFDLDATRSGVSLEHVVLHGMHLRKRENYKATELPEDLPNEAKLLVRYVLSDVPKAPGSYRVYFRQDADAFTLEGSQCPLYLEEQMLSEGRTYYRVTVMLGAVELPSTGNRQLDVMQQRGGQDHSGDSLIIDGAHCEQVVAEALYHTRMRTGRVIESVLRD